MKKFFLLAFIVLVCVSGCSKPKGLDGFLDIPWGENIENAARILEEKGYSYRIPHEGSITAQGKFAGLDAELSLRFIKGKFYGGTVEFPSKDSETDYDEYVSLVTEKYGKPSRTVHNDDILATAWEFDNNTGLDVSFTTHVSTSYLVSSKYFDNNSKQKEKDRQAAMNDL
jgi:hypothetical protein